MYTKSKKIIIICILITLALGVGIGVSATTLLYSSDVTYDNSSSGLSSTNLQDALDELYEQAKSAPSCDSNGVCTVTCPSDKPDYVATSTGYRCAKTAKGTLLKNVVTSGDGLYVDDTESGRYVYKGATPNNYITFSGETWRILAIESDGTLKIMKQDSIGSMLYDSNASGAWSSATLNTYLNGTYYNSLSTTAKSYIQNYSFNVGNVGNSNSLIITINQEKSTTWTGNIALANVSDYIKSNTNTSSCGSLNSIQSNTSTCQTSSFIGTTMASSQPWLLSLDSVNPNYVWAWYVNSSGNYWSNYVNSSYYGVHPVLHLSSSITLSGSGTEFDSYQISG